MILTNEVTRIFSKHRPRAEKESIRDYLGYMPEHGDEYTIPVELLKGGAKDKVKVKCDYCEKTLKNKIPYSSYISSINNTPIKKYACAECKYRRRKEHEDYKQQNGTLKKSDPAYYNYPENRKNSLDEWLSKNGAKESLSQSSIYSAYKNRNEDIWKDVRDLGYDENVVRLNKGLLWWIDEGNFIKFIDKLVEKYGIDEVMKSEFLHNLLPSDAYRHYDGIEGIRTLLDYQNKKNLDNQGRAFRSSYEAFSSNFFLAHKMKPKYEERISEDQGHKFDFDLTEYSKISKKVFIEIWGYRKSEKGFAERYNKRRKIKEKIYESQSDEIQLVSLEQYHFKGSYVKRAEAIYMVLSEYIHIDEIDYTTVDLSPKGEDYLTDEKLVEILRGYTSDGVHLPDEKVLIKKNHNVFSKTKERYGRFGRFCEKFGLIPKGKEKGYWTSNRRIERLDEMVEQEGYLITNTRIIKEDPELYNKYSDLLNFLVKTENGGWKRNIQSYKKLRNLDDIDLTAPIKFN